MIYRGKFTCPYCGEAYNWVSESRHKLYGSGLPDVVDYGRAGEIHVSMNYIDDKLYVSGYCPCGYPLYVPNESNTDNV